MAPRRRPALPLRIIAVLIIAIIAIVILLVILIITTFLVIVVRAPPRSLLGLDLHAAEERPRHCVAPPTPVARSILDFRVFTGFRS
jgi:hypothetical protein